MPTPEAKGKWEDRWEENLKGEKETEDTSRGKCVLVKVVVHCKTVDEERLKMNENSKTN